MTSIAELLKRLAEQGGQIVRAEDVHDDIARSRAMDDGRYAQTLDGIFILLLPPAPDQQRRFETSPAHMPR